MLIHKKLDCPKAVQFFSHIPFVDHDSQHKGIDEEAGCEDDFNCSNLRRVKTLYEDEHLSNHRHEYAKRVVRKGVFCVPAHESNEGD